VERSNLLNNALSIHKNEASLTKNEGVIPALMESSDSDLALFEKLRKPLPDKNQPYAGINLERDDPETNPMNMIDYFSNPSAHDNLDDNARNTENKKTKHATPKKGNIKAIYIFLGGTFLVIICLFVIILSYMYSANPPPNMSQQANFNSNKLDVSAENNTLDIQQLINDAVNLEQNNNPIEGLKKRISAVNSYIKLGEYLVALEEAKVIADKLKAQFSNTNNVAVNQLKIYHNNFLSEIYYHLNDMEKAVTYSNEALKLSLIHHSQEPLNSVKQYHLLAFNLDNIGDFDQALKMRHNAVNLTLRLDSNLIDEGQLISEMNNLGQEYRTLGHLAKSEMILMTTIKRIEKGYGIDAPELIVVLNNLGLTQQENDNRTIALAYLQQAYHLAYRHYNADHELTRSIAQNIKRSRSLR
jgi:tetratricopeptide (TPR) repeat protein